MLAHHTPACYLKRTFPSLQVCKAGEAVMVAGVVAAVGFGIVALAGALFGGSSKENNNTQ